MGKKRGPKKGAGPTVQFSDDQLKVILTMLTANDTNVIKNGEKQLAPFLLHHSCIPPLMTQVMHCQELAVKTQAAILLKRKVSGHYAKFAAGEQEQLKAQMLQMLTTEADKQVATALAGAVASVAHATFANGGSWEELFAALLHLSKDANEVLRARNYNLLAQLGEKISDHLKPHVTTLAQMLAMGCGDPAGIVKVEAMQATTSFIMALQEDPEVMALEPVMRPLFGVMQQCLKEGNNEQVVAEGMDVIQEAVAMEQPLVNGHIDALVPFIVHIIENPELEATLKGSAAHTLVALVEHRPKLISKANMVPPILQSMTNLIAAADPTKAGKLFVMGSNEKEGILEDEEDDDDFDEEDETIRVPGYVLDAMAIHVPGKFFTAPALQITASCMSSQDANQRKAGCALLGLIAEGCNDHLRTILAQVLPPLLSSVQDGEYFVREVACFALGQMSEHCQPEILQFHNSVLPVIFSALDDTHQSIQTTICWVLEMFCEFLQPETLQPFLEPMLEKLVKLLNNPSRNIKEMALSAISATATASEKNFVPYTASICGLLHPIIFLQGEKEESVRGRALETLSHISLAIGKEHFQPYFAESMNAAGQALKEESDVLAEYVLVFFTNACKTMGDNFGNYLPDIMPTLQERIEAEEIIKFGSEDDEEVDVDVAGGDDGDDDEFEDIDDDDSAVYFAPEEGFVQAKKAAICCVGVMAENCHTAFLPYLQPAIALLLEHGIKSIHDVVQAETCEALSLLVKSAAKTAGIRKKPKAGEMVTPLPEHAELTSGAARAVLIVCLSIVTKGKSKSTVASALNAIGLIITTIGVLALNLDATNADESNNWTGPVANVLMVTMLELIQEKCPCQIGVEGKEEDEDDDEDHDQYIPDALSELMGDLSRALGPAFIPYFDQFFPALMKYTKPSRSHSDRAMALGCIGDVSKELGPQAIKYAETVLPVLQVSLQDPMESVRRNSAFCVGMLCQATEKQLAPHFPHILHFLAPLCQRSADQQNGGDSGGADIDNTLSAVARMIRSAAEAVPLGQVLPVLLDALPLRADHEEGDNIYGCLIELLQTKNEATMALFPRVVGALGATLIGGSKSNDATKAMCITAIHGLANSPEHKDLLSAAVGAGASTWGAEVTQAVTAAASGTMPAPVTSDE